ncbi:MAG: hypothetical protein ACKVOG_08370 [Rhodoglobus sp.]
MYVPFSVVDVLLDERNPRFADPVSSQPEAVNALIRQGSTKLLALMEDIAVKGALDPTNPPIVMLEGDDVIVLEGNRRFAALKLLRNPDLANGDAVRTKIRAIKALAVAAGKSADGPDNITCFVAADRAEAQPWIELRHTGENGGVGTDPWNPYQSVSFRRRPGTAEDRAWLFVRAVIASYDEETALLHDVRTIRDEKFTNLARLIARPHVRAQMKFEIHGDTVTLDTGDDFATEMLRIVFSDLKSMTVDNIRTPELQDAYINDVVALARERFPAGQPGGSQPGGGQSGGGGTGGTGGGPSGGSGGGTSGGGTTSGGTATGGRGGRRTPRPDTKIYQTVTLRHVSLRTSSLLVDAQKVKIDTAPGVCAVMLRVILEMAVTEVGVERGWFEDGAKLRSKFKIALKKLDPNIEHTVDRDRALAMAWINSQADASGSGLGVDQMNAYVHSYLADPGPANVRALSSAFKPFLQRLDDYAGENPVT